MEAEISEDAKRRGGNGMAHDTAISACPTFLGETEAIN
jgi:hypothetical protein